MTPIDPLTLLPPEIILRILEFAPVSALAAATRLSKAWHKFIDETHQDAIYSVTTKTIHPEGVHDFNFLQDSQSFAKYFEGVLSWKDLCKRQILLPRNWDLEHPVTRESVLQVGNDPIWRFRPDFKRRFFLSTSQAGGLNVTDMDSGLLLWRLPHADEHDGTGNYVRAYAHLEYEDGTAVWDRYGDAVEVWRTGLEGLGRGEFRRVAILPHECQTRGFMLKYGTLCVVSTEGHGFMYDTKADPPELKTRLEIRDDAIGHLYQDEDVVVYSMGERGYDFHDKVSGKALGTLRPWHAGDVCHIEHPAKNTSVGSREVVPRHGPTPQIFPPGAPRVDRLHPIHLKHGPLPGAYEDGQVPIQEDEWGAGMLEGNLMVGVSRQGRLYICWDWKKVLETPAEAALYSCIVECDSDDGANFDLGGWLSVKDNRILFEIQDRVYVLALDDEGRIQDVQQPPKRASYSFLTSSVPQLAVAVSFMALYDDCIMATYTTLGSRQRIAADDGEQAQEEPARIFPTKAIRILSLAPDLEGGDEQAALWEPPQPVNENERRQARLLRLVGMLGDELAEDDLII